MACFYTLRLPAAQGVTAETLFGELADWLANDCGHGFQQITLTDLSSPLDIATPQAQFTAARCKIDNVGYTALRLRSDTSLFPALPGPENQRYTADFLIEERSDGCNFGLRLHVTPLDANKSVGFPSFTMPEILWRLAEKGLLAEDGGLPLQKTQLTVTAPLENRLQQLRSGAVFSVRPLLLVREGNFALTPTLSARLCQCVHMLVLSGMHPALTGLGAGSARILFPRLRVSRAVDLTVPSACEDILEYTARLTALALPVELPSFEYIQCLGAGQTQPAADYLCLNRRMAESIRFYRVKSGLTQNELAQKAGTTGLLISRLENCRPARVRESLIMAIENALHLKNREILACEGLSVQEGSVIPRPAYCPICGTKTAEIGDFCAGCGSKLM